VSAGGSSWASDDAGATWEEVGERERVEIEERNAYGNRPQTPAPTTPLEERIIQDERNRMFAVACRGETCWATDGTRIDEITESSRRTVYQRPDSNVTDGELCLSSESLNDVAIVDVDDTSAIIAPLGRVGVVRHVIGEETWTPTILKETEGASIDWTDFIAPGGGTGLLVALAALPVVMVCLALGVRWRRRH
jgi:hypothetical protein